jgi:hypothetical protein
MKHSSSLTWVFILAMLFAIAVLALGAVVGVKQGQWAMLAAGCVSVVAVIVSWALALQLAAVHGQSQAAWEQLNTTFTERMEQFSVMLNVISEQQLLSDRGKAVAYRAKDREALHRAIREETAGQHYDAALLLVSDMENAFGYKQEAEQLRAEINQARDTVIRRIVTDAKVRIDHACNSEKWDDALAEAARVAALYPGHELTANLPAEVQARKDAFKRHLLDSFHDAIGRKDEEAAMQSLNQLDLYLTADEVREIRETAKGVLKARIEGYREHYAVCVREGKWREAIRIAEDIIAEFPTSKLAGEVSGMMETLLSRATEPATSNA